MAKREVSKNSGKDRLGNLVGVVIDIALLSVVIYVGWVIALGSLTYVEGIIRHDLLGYRPSVDVAEISRQTLSAPLISGRPALFHIIITYIGPAITVLLYLHFLKLTTNGSSPGTILVHRRFSKTLSARGGVRWAKVIAEGSALAQRELQSTIADRLGFKGWQEVFGGLRDALVRVRDLAAPVTALPQAARWAAWMSLSAVLILSAASPILYAYNGNLAHFAFEDVNSQAASIPVIAFYLSLAGLVLGWAVVLVGASLTSTVLLLVVAVFYIFCFVFIGIGGGRSWWLPLPQWMVLLLAAATPVPRRRLRWLRFVAVWALAAIAIFHSMRLTPLPRLALSRAWICTVPRRIHLGGVAKATNTLTSLDSLHLCCSRKRHFRCVGAESRSCNDGGWIVLLSVPIDGSDNSLLVSTWRRLC